MRTDVHAPKNLRPEDYEFVACGNYGTADIDAFSPLATTHKHVVDEGWRFDGASGGNCNHCGSFIIYYAILKHLPTHTLIKVGETCLDNRFSLANAEFQKLRKAAKLNRERTRLADKRTEFLEFHPDSAVAYTWAKEQPAFDGDNIETFEAKFVRYIDRYGEASDKFVDAILRAKQRKAEWEAKRAEEALTATPVIEGKVTIEGEILSVKLKTGYYGESLKMTVKDDRGFKVWGTVPSSLPLMFDCEGHPADEFSPMGETQYCNGKCNPLKGKRVKFTATVTKSDKDDTFGFFKRPTKAEVL